MTVNIIDGKLIKISNRYDEIKEYSKNLTGYIRVSVKSSDGFEDGYIFLRNGKEIGYYYEYGSIKKFGKDAKELIDKMKDKSYYAEIYEYDDEKMDLMMDLYKEMFIKLPKPSKKTTYLEDDLSKNEAEERLKISLSLPEGKPIKLGANEEYKEYLEGYRLVEVFKKEGSSFKRAYIIYKDGKPILASYEDENGVLLGKKACPYIKVLLSNYDVIDVYEYTPIKVEVVVEYYPEMNLIEKNDEDKKTINDEEDEEDLEAFVENLKNKREEIYGGENEETENLSKEELLQKLGIKLPDEDTIEEFVNNLIAPTSDELKALEEEFREKIEEILKKEPSIEKYSLDVSVDFDEGYICKCVLILTPRKKFGILKENINTEYIYDKIRMIIKNNLIDIEPEILITVN